jgi:hypothetical protein
MESLWAVADVSASGADIQGLALALEPGVTVSGRIAFDGTTEPPQDLSQFRVSIRMNGWTPFLEPLFRRLRITIGDGEKKVQNLRLGAAR